LKLKNLLLIKSTTDLYYKMLPANTSASQEEHGASGHKKGKERESDNTGL